jgi:hypothetical protein
LVRWRRFRADRKAASTASQAVKETRYATEPLPPEFEPLAETQVVVGDFVEAPVAAAVMAFTEDPERPRAERARLRDTADGAAGVGCGLELGEIVEVDADASLRAVEHVDVPGADADRAA